MNILSKGLSLFRNVTFSPKKIFISVKDYNIFKKCVIAISHRNIFYESYKNIQTKVSWLFQTYLAPVGTFCAHLRTLRDLIKLLFLPNRNRERRHFFSDSWFSSEFTIFDPFLAEVIFNFHQILRQPLLKGCKLADKIIYISFTTNQFCKNGHYWKQFWTTFRYIVHFEYVWCTFVLHSIVGYWSQ